ncbi:GD17442 [Drosophila simulans]|uniref:GD17442 n=1 Tax=Drosophila simulans TaxID=7240 RepID=B4R7Q3_DROSI|nr:GD17442 [Drosophila simulans]
MEPKHSANPVPQEHHLIGCACQSASLVSSRPRLLASSRADRQLGISAVGGNLGPANGYMGVGIWLCGYVDIWVNGSMGIWVYGYWYWYWSTGSTGWIYWNYPLIGVVPGDEFINKEYVLRDGDDVRTWFGGNYSDCPYPIRYD